MIGVGTKGAAAGTQGGTDVAASFASHFAYTSSIMALRNEISKVVS